MANKIKICKGAGCKAWKSEHMAKRLSQLQGSNGVCLVPCMRQCGGGASVQFEGHDEVLKLRETEEVVFLTASGVGALAAAC